MEKYAPAARVNAFRQQVKAAEDAVTAVDKEKTKLEKSIQSAQSNTAANLKRIEELLRQNKANATQMHQDSAQLVVNGQNRETAQQQLEKRRERLSGVAPK
jgi:seryl-tRNA synthetase